MMQKKTIFDAGSGARITGIDGKPFDLADQVRQRLSTAPPNETPEQERKRLALLTEFSNRRASFAAEIAKGVRNMYVCDTCFGHIITLQIDKGVPPYLVGCLATLNCRGMMQSSLNRVYDQRVRADFEWHKPTAEEVASYPEDARQHIAQNGLTLRIAEHLRKAAEASGAVSPA